jgi:hypothetical protein
MFVGVASLAVPADASNPHLMWRQITLTFAGKTVDLPDIRREFDSTNGPACSRMDELFAQIGLPPN